MAVKAHGDQKYGEHPYSFHLDAVAALVAPYEDSIILAYLHDTLEDTKLTKDEIEAVYGPFITCCVDLLTDQPGPNRKARKTATYARLQAIEAASPEHLVLTVKAADRLANVRQCVEDGNKSLLKMYADEHDAFLFAVFRKEVNADLIEKIHVLLG